MTKMTWFRGACLERGAQRLHRVGLPAALEFPMVRRIGAWSEHFGLELPPTRCRGCVTVTGSEGTADQASSESLASIFERIPRPRPAKTQAPQGEALELFADLARPSDVAMQFAHAAKTNVKDVRTWEVLSTSAVKYLRYLRMSEVSAILHSCAQASWRDENLLMGLTEAWRCGAELRRGTVRDYSLCCQSLRRLDFCPWNGALKPVVMELRWRLRHQTWRSVDIVFVLRFLAEFRLHRMSDRGLTHAGSLTRELQERAERRLGEMPHLEMAHFARALAQLDAGGGLPDFTLLERIAENFSRRSENLPLGALLHVTSTLLHAHGMSRTSQVSAPSEFVQVLTQRAQTDLAKLSPREITVLAIAAARFGINDEKFLKYLGLAVTAELDRFNTPQVALVAESFVSIGFHHRALINAIERKLAEVSNLKPGSRFTMVTPRDRNRMLVALLNTAARGNIRPELTGRWAEDLAAALPKIDPRPKFASDAEALLTGNGSVQPALKQFQTRRVAKQWTPPRPISWKPLRPRKKKKTEVAAPVERKITVPAPEKPWSPDDLGDQLAALEEIAGSLSKQALAYEDTQVEPEPVVRGGVEVKGVAAVSGGGQRRSRRGNIVEVPSYVPEGASVLRAKALVPNAGELAERKLGSTHPAARRIVRRLHRLEKDLGFGKDKSVPFKEIPDSSKQPRKLRPKGSTPQAQAAIIWRRLRRYRLSGFLAEQCNGRFVKSKSDVLLYMKGGNRHPSTRPESKISSKSPPPTDRKTVKRARVVETFVGQAETDGVDLEQAAALSLALNSQGGAKIPGRLPLLKSLGVHAAGISEIDNVGWLAATQDGGRAASAAVGKRRRTITLLCQMGNALVDAGFDCEPLRMQLRILAEQSLPSKQSTPGVDSPQMPSSDRSLAKSFRVAARLAVAHDFSQQAERTATGIQQTNPDRLRALEELTPLLNHLLQSPPTSTSSKPIAGPLWTLPLDELSSTLSAAAALARHVGVFETSLSDRIRRGLDARLSAASFSPAHGIGISLTVGPTAHTPPSAAMVTEVAACSFWLSRHEVCGPPSAEEPLPPQVADICRRWAVSPRRVRSVVAKWSQGEF